MIVKVKKLNTKLLTKDKYCKEDIIVQIDQSLVSPDVPMGTAEITTTEKVNVAPYEYAQVVDENLVAENIASGKSILGINGTFSQDATATAEDILSGKTAYVGGKLITGNFEIGGTIEITDTEIKDVTNYQYAQVVDENLVAENIASGKSILGINGTFSDNSTGIIDGTITEIYNAEVTKIRYFALFNTGLISVNFPNATSIGGSAFQNCYDLKSVNIPLATSIGDRAFFRNNSLINIIFHNAKSIGSEAFYDCRILKSAKFPKVETIYGYAFSYTNLTDIYLGYEGVVTISNTSIFGNPNVTAHVKPNFDLTALYAEATNWSSLIASGKVTIVEDYVE